MKTTAAGRQTFQARVTSADLEQLDRLVALLQRDSPELHVNRSSAIRIAVYALVRQLSEATTTGGNHA